MQEQLQEVEDRQFAICGDCTNKYYTSKQLLNDAKKHFPSVKITVNGKDYYYTEQDEITILRNNIEMKILAKDFNEETDLFGC